MADFFIYDGFLLHYSNFVNRHGAEEQRARGGKSTPTELDTSLLRSGSGARRGGLAALATDGIGVIA